MKKNQIKQGIDERLARLKFRQTEPEEMHPRRKAHYLCKTWAAAVATLLCLALLTGGVTVFLPKLQNMALNSSQKNQEEYVPPEVSLVSENNGIRVEVVECDKNMVSYPVIKLKVTDLTGKMDFSDENGAFYFRELQIHDISGRYARQLGMGASSSPVEGGKNSFYLEITGTGGDWDNGAISKISITMRDVISHWSEELQWDLGCTLEDLFSAQAQTRKVSVESMLNQEVAALTADEDGFVTVLAPGQRSFQPKEKVNGFVSSIGMVGDILHVQVHYDKKLQNGNFTGVQLENQLYLDSEFLRYPPLLPYSVGEDETSQMAVDYSFEEDGGYTVEFLYDLSQETMEEIKGRYKGELSQLRLTAMYTTLGDEVLVEGNWQLVVEPASFPVGSVQK